MVKKLMWLRTKNNPRLVVLIAHGRGSKAPEQM